MDRRGTVDDNPGDVSAAIEGGGATDVHRGGVSRRMRSGSIQKLRARLPKSYWWLALQHSCHISSLLPWRSDNSMSGWRAFTGKKPSVGWVRVWGCLCYPKLYNRQSKVHEQSERHIFVGLAPDQPGYCAVDPRTGIFTYSPHVRIALRNARLVSCVMAAMTPYGLRLPMSSLTPLMLNLTHLILAPPAWVMRLLVAMAVTPPPPPLPDLPRIFLALRKAS